MVKTLVYECKSIAEIFVADSFIKRFLGFMFRKKPHHEAILIKPCNSIHTFFMKFPIDVLFINENMEVIKKINNLSSRRIVMPVIGAVAVLEAEVGSFRNISIGEKIEVEDYIFNGS